MLESSANGKSPLEVHRQATVGGPTADALWDLYCECYEPLLTTAAAAHRMCQSEFAERLADPAVAKIVATRASQPVAMAMMVTDLAKVPWVSEPFYRAHFGPDAPLWYFGAFAVVPAERRSLAAGRVLEAAVSWAAENQAVVCYDFADENTAMAQMPRAVERFARRWGRPVSRCMSTQRFWAIWDVDWPGLPVEPSQVAPALGVQ